MRNTITELAGYGDNRMRDISANNKSIDITKVAHAGGYKCAHELFSLGRRMGRRRGII